MRDRRASGRNPLGASLPAVGADAAEDEIQVATPVLFGASWLEVHGGHDPAGKEGESATGEVGADGSGRDGAVKSAHDPGTLVAAGQGHVVAAGFLEGTRVA